MKKIFTITTVLGLGALIAFSCKKSTTTTTTATTTTSTTGTNSTPTNTTTTNYSVDGTAAVNITVHGNASSPYFVVQAAPTSTYPSLQIAFSGTTAPVSGTYSITTSTTPTANQCIFAVTTASGNTSPASSGVVTVTAAATPSNTVVFTGITCGAHTVTGALKY
jgi:hypothetical protein